MDSREERMVGRSDAALRHLGVGTAVLALALCATALGLRAWYGHRGVAVPVPHSGDLVLGSLFPAAGALVVWKQPRNACGWVLLSSALVAVSVLAHTWAYATGVADVGSLPFGDVAVWLAAWTFVPYWAQPALLPVLFPDGHLPSARWRPFLKVVLGLLAVLALSAMLGPNDEVSDLGLANPLGIRAPGLDVAGPALQMGSGLALWLVASPVAVAALVRRQQRAEGAERAQLQWLLLGLVGLLVLTVASAALPQHAGGELLFAAGFACVPLSLVVAVLRHRMLDVEAVVGRAVSWAALSGLGMVAYLVALGLAGRALRVDGSGPVIAALVVAVAAAARVRVQRWVDRRLFGARRDPYAVLHEVGTSTAAAPAPDAALQALVDTVRRSLHLPLVQVLDEAGTSLASAGEPVAGTDVVPVVVRGRRLGVLVVGRRWARERRRPEETSALGEVARRAGSLLAERQLAADLQTSYAELVRVREEERRRLRRELHDEVGPALAGTALQLDSLAGRLSATPELAERAERLRDRLQGTVTEVRRIVDGLRPAAVDELGLPAALRAFETAPEERVHVEVDADLPDGLPAGVEVAAYRIAGEAVANALRHAEARRATVRAHVRDGDLLLSVTDDGAGFGTDVTAGVGLQSMHDRASEVGGRLSVESAPGAGTVVHAVLPLQQEGT